MGISSCCVGLTCGQGFLSALFLLPFPFWAPVSPHFLYRCPLLERMPLVRAGAGRVALTGVGSLSLASGYSWLGGRGATVA